MNNPLPLISLIIPVYNSEKYLDRCLQSVVAQDYPELEIILINDGSNDSSPAILEKYKREYPNKIVVISQKNLGASLSRKKGIKASRGEYLMFADSDDCISNKYVSAHYQAIRDCKSEISISRFRYVEEANILNRDSKIKTRLMNKEELFKRFFKYEFWGMPGGCYKRDLFNDVIFPIETINEDYYVKAQIFLKSQRIAYVENTLYFYDRHIGSLSTLKLSKRALGEFDNVTAAWEYIKKNAPEYSRQALAIASESSCKLLGLLKKDKSEEYETYGSNIKRFVKKHGSRIFSNPFLLWKIKIQLLINYISVK